MKYIYIIILFPAFMFGQIKQINTTLFSSNNNSIGSHSSLESDLFNAISLHNTIRTYQSNPILTYDDGLSLSAEEWANVIINTGNFDFDPSVPSYIGENLYRGNIAESNNILNYNPYLDAVTYWATNRKGDGVSFENMTLSDFSKIGMGVAYGNGKVVVVARYK